MDQFELWTLRELVNSGLKDRESQVRDACVDLFCHWFEGQFPVSGEIRPDYLNWMFFFFSQKKGYDRDAEKFLSHFKVRENEEITELIIKHLMLRLQPTSYDFSEFSTEAVFFWRLFCEFINRKASVNADDSEVCAISCAASKFFFSEYRDVPDARYFPRAF